MARLRSVAMLQAPRTEPGDIRPWPYDARYSRPAMTVEQARREAFYGYRMHEAAMRNQINQFTEGKPR